jgi:hypothetical protein
MKHCDDYIEDPTAPAPLRKFLEHARSPGHGHSRPKPHPTLFATYNGDDWLGIRKGDRVRVVMASRMGDVGITKDLEASHGYQVRCNVDVLADFSEAAR